MTQDPGASDLKGTRADFKRNYDGSYDDQNQNPNRKGKGRGGGATGGNKGKQPMYPMQTRPSGVSDATTHHTGSNAPTAQRRDKSPPTKGEPTHATKEHPRNPTGQQASRPLDGKENTGGPRKNKGPQTSSHDQLAKAIRGMRIH